jgi:mannosyl-3-phosphoglycerate phosphatase
MTSSPTLGVFTDLDGTLLDHQTYRWDPAGEALAALQQMGAAVILASSKTAAEMAPIRAAMGLERWPAIVENGAGVLPAGRETGEGVSRYADLRAALDDLHQDLRAGFTGFGDMTAAQVAEVTGLPLDGAVLARQRAFSEPGLWTGDDTNRASFIAALADRGVTAREGGRFLTLSFGGTKADRLAGIADDLRMTHTVALGDAPNDIEMLEAADEGVIVANPHRSPLPLLQGEAAGRITRTTLPGPQGWNAAILAIVGRRAKETGQGTHG